MEAAELVEVDGEVGGTKGAIQRVGHSPEAPKDASPRLHLGSKPAQEVIHVEMRVSAMRTFRVCRRRRIMMKVVGKKEFVDFTRRNIGQSEGAANVF